MKLWPRSPSLFWTFAGSFLAALTAALMLQIWLVVVLAGDMADSRADDHATRAVDELTNALTAASQPLEPPTVIRALRRTGQSYPELLFVFHSDEGHAIPDRPLPPSSLEAVEALLGISIALGPPPRAEDPSSPGFHRPPPRRPGRGPPGPGRHRPGYPPPDDHLGPPPGGRFDDGPPPRSPGLENLEERKL